MRRSPAIEASFNPDAPRLACVRPAASVHPEPGSNSPLYKKIIKILESWLLKFPLKELINTALYLFFSNNTSNSKNLFHVLKRSQKSLKKSLGILSESDCKDKRSYLNFQIFQRKIREPHFKNLPAKPCCFRLAGANVGTFSDSPNFRELFLRFSCIFPVLILQVPAHDPEQITD